MATSLLAYDGRYAGMFVALADPAPLAELPVPLGVTRSIYRSPQLAIAVLMAAEHPEPVLDWLQSAHDNCEGSSFLAEVLFTGAEVPGNAHCHLLRAPFADLDEGLAVELKRHSVLTVRLPFSDEMLVLCDAETGRELCAGRGRLSNAADFGLSLIGTEQRPPPKRSPAPAAYDPVGAQATETLRGTAGAFEDNLAQVRRLLRDVFGFEPPAELVSVEREVRSLLAAARRRLDEAAANQIDDEVAITALDVAGEVGTDFTERLGRLAEQLSAHRDVPDPWTRPMAYARAGEPYALRAVRALVAETSRNLAPTQSARMLVPVLGGGFASQRGVLGPMSFVVRDDAPSGWLITYPRRLSLRAGALPVLAGTVVAAACELGPLNDRLVDGDLRRAGRAIGVRLEDGSEEQRQAAGARAATLIGDLVATAVCGPAYVFALARFTPGLIGGGPALLPSSRAPGLAERITLCLRLLRRLRIHADFASAYVEPDRRPLDADLAELTLGLVEVRYDGRIERLRPITEALTRGEVVSEPPTLLLNALWTAVVRRSGYLNEVALYESLVQASA